MGVPPNHHFLWIFPFKPSIVGYLHFWKSPCVLLQSRPLVIGSTPLAERERETLSGRQRLEEGTFANSTIMI